MKNGKYDTTKPVIDALGALDWTLWSMRSSHVKKIVVGSLDQDIDGSLPVDLEERFPGLTHLHVWGLRDTTSLPQLPTRLAVLDVRNCRRLTSIPPIPPTLRELVVRDCEALRRAEFGQVFEQLVELELIGCPDLEPADIDAALRNAPTLRHLDLSGCKQITTIRCWPGTHQSPGQPRSVSESALERIELNNCTALAAVPSRWPPNLRRLGLRNASLVRRIPEFKAWPDYVDLAGTASLASIPRPRAVRTLFLHGSGVLMPPATEHGRAADENVAAQTLAYFDDVEQFGQGSVTRCKLLVLGNGSAGKTTLSLALMPGEDPKRARDLGSTHGVQFWSRTLPATVNGVVEDVQLQVWDFGGQEIYHQTHRLFMGKASVFVIVWDPEQDGRQAPPSGSGYLDTWRPLRYWTDLVALACPAHPRVAIVCSKRSSRSDALDRRWQEQVDPALRSQVRCFYVDSFERQGDLPKLIHWLEESVGDVVAAQGTAVPSHWEIAQDMVSRWVASEGRALDGRDHGVAETMTPTEFARRLDAEVADVVENDDCDRFGKLREARSAGVFVLDAVRVTRTLEFLTHSGWIYWDRSLFEQRVIIGQKWALDGIYAVLERRNETPIYDMLRSARGRFTLRELAAWGWDKLGYSGQQQELLLSFMVQAGVCFRMVRRDESWWGWDVFCTFEHLPEHVGVSKDAGRRESSVPSTSRRLDGKSVHRGHWNALLQSLGTVFGTDADYAIDGFSVRNREGQEICISLSMDAVGIGGSITVEVRGDRADERLVQVLEHVGRHLPVDAPSAAQSRSPESHPVGTPSAAKRLFISYAWNPRTEAQQELVGGPVSSEYEEPVDVIHRALERHTGSVRVLRDKTSLVAGDSITEFMKTAKVAEKVLVVHSDKYWRSPYCMFELCSVFEGFAVSEREMKRTLILLELPNSRVTDSAARDEYVEYWRSVKSIPVRLEKAGTSLAKLKVAAENCLLNVIPTLHDEGISKRWSATRPDEVVRWVKQQFELVVDAAGA